MAGLQKYFKLKQRHEDNDDEEKPKGLPNGDLNKVVPSSSTEVTNSIDSMCPEVAIYYVSMLTRLYASH